MGAVYVCRDIGSKVKPAACISVVERGAVDASASNDITRRELLIRVYRWNMNIWMRASAFVFGLCLDGRRYNFAGRPAVFG